jgi:hypothetical protein
MSSCTEEMQMILPAARERAGSTPWRTIVRAATRVQRNVAGEVDAHHGVPLLEDHVDQGRVALQPGAVDEDVQARPLARHRGEHGLDLSLAGDVAGD